MPLSKKNNYFESESENDEGNLESYERSKRPKKAPTRFKDNYIPTVSSQELLAGETKVMVKCSQLGDRFVKQVADLSRHDDEPVTQEDLTPGSSLLVSFQGCPYPVEVVGTVDDLQKSAKKNTTKTTATKSFKHNQSVTERKRKILNAAACDERAKRQKTTVHHQDTMSEDTNDDQVGTATQNATTSKEITRTPTRTVQNIITSEPGVPTNRNDNVQIPFTKEDHDLLLEIHSMLRKVLRKQTQEGGKTSNGVCSKQDDNQFLFNGVNLLSLRARDVHQYSLSLMDVLFSKDELANSLVKKTMRSTKPALDEDRVKLIEDCLDRKFGNEFDKKSVIQKMNQKCHDSRKALKKEN